MEKKDIKNINDLIIYFQTENKKLKKQNKLLLKKINDLDSSIDFCFILLVIINLFPFFYVLFKVLEFFA